ncbi:MAG: hypothetical protein EOP48_04930 [Sphingobacteriales bacterium]|nr:MAG: hypothetical protein EOP48_04930 [Sphingobacteriales bacterium]
MKAIIWVNRIFLGLFLLLSMLAIAGKVVFGYGLGDIIYCIFLWMTTIAFAITYFHFSRKKTIKTHLITTIIFAFILLFLIYSMTWGRGVEYRWNGNLFYSN